MKRVFFVIIRIGLLLGWSVMLKGQYTTGLIIDEQAIEAIPVISHNNYGAKSNQEISRQIRKVDLKPYCPTVGNQSNTASCVGWSVGYGAFTIQKAIAYNWKDRSRYIDDNAFSAMFIYNQIQRKGCNGGAKISDALQLLMNQGDLLSRDFEENRPDCTLVPGSDHFEKAKQFRIKNYYRLFDHRENGLGRLQKIKASLATNHPVIAALKIRENFVEIKDDQEFWWPALGNTNSFGLHAMVIVGFDDDKEAFEIMNSWGKNWGKQGFIWIKYKDFARYCLHAFQLVLQQKTEINTQTFGTFYLRYHTFEKSQLDFKPVRTIFKDGLSELENPWPVNWQFQLVANRLTKGNYLYVFSLDSKNKIRVHRPKYEHLINASVKVNDSARILVDDSQIVIPGNSKAFKIDQPGIHYLCILISRSVIEGFHQSLEKVRLSTGNIKDRLKAGWGNSMTSDPGSNLGKDRRIILQTSSGDLTICQFIFKVEVRETVRK